MANSISKEDLESYVRHILRVGDILRFRAKKNSWVSLWGVYAGKLPQKEFDNYETNEFTFIHISEKCSSSGYCLHDLRDFVLNDGYFVFVDNFDDQKNKFVYKQTQKHFQRKILNELEDPWFRSINLHWNKSKFYASVIRYGKEYANSQPYMIKAAKYAISGTAMVVGGMAPAFIAVGACSFIDLFK